FAEWVHQRAAALGAERALCAMREGRFLQKIVDGASGVPGRHLGTQTVWASRESCARASIYDGSEFELRSFLSRLNAPGPRQVSASLGLDANDVPELRALIADPGTPGAGDSSAGEAVIDLVLGREHLRQAVVDRSRLLRRRLVDHLAAAAGPGTGPVVVVDVGWAGTILEALQRMLNAEGADLSLHGLFVGAHVGSARPLLRGVPLEGYLGDSGLVPFDVAGITGNPELVELACMCDEGSFLEMGEDGEPVLAPSSTTPLQREHRTLLQAGARAFQAAWLPQRDIDSSHETSPAGRATLRRVLERFLSQPDRQEAEAFSWWGHEENFGSEQIDRLVPTKLRPTLHLRTVDSLHFAPPNELYWVGGAASLVDEETADAIFLMRRGLLAPGRIDASLGIGSAGIFVVHADGTERLVAEVPLLANRRGISLVEWNGDPQGATEVRVRLAERPAILRLDRLEVVYRDGSGATVNCRAWTPSTAMDGYVMRGATPLEDHTFAVDDRSRLTLTVPSGIGVRSTTVVVAGSYLPISRSREEVGARLDAVHRLTAFGRELNKNYRTKLSRATTLPRGAYRRLRHALHRLET
ncbi:MAG: hypothetical protein ACRDYD_01260, partial [Acidimicrobiales bacterium]